MPVEIIDNRSRDLASVLLPAIESCQDIRIAVAFVSSRGLSMIETPVWHSLQAGASIEFLVGLDLSVTEPKALWKLYELSRSHASVDLYCYTDLGPSVTYHPKLYVMRAGEQVIAVLGSSNLTEGGLKRNIEVNAVIRGGIQEEIVSDLYSAYNRLKFDPRRVEPDEELLTLYRQLWEGRRRQEGAFRRDKLAHGLLQEFQKKAGTLRRAKPTMRDLVGWLRLVYEALPAGEFTNKEVYAHQMDFQSCYPDNRNIQAKIRQQLQELRNIGLIEHLGQARWRRL